MKSEAQRIAIAQACGWKDFGTPLECGTLWGTRPENGYRSMVPFYCNDLNAMHEAEKTLTDEQFFDFSKAKNEDKSYHGWLGRLVDRSTSVDRPCRYYSATAAQRAEAFLRTLGLWEE